MAPCLQGLQPGCACESDGLRPETRPYINLVHVFVKPAETLEEHGDARRWTRTPRRTEIWMFGGRATNTHCNCAGHPGEASASRFGQAAMGVGLLHTECRDPPG